MKKEIHPAVFIVAIVIIVGVIGWFMWSKATGITEEPSANLHPKGMGSNPGRSNMPAGQPGQGSPNGP